MQVATDSILGLQEVGNLGKLITNTLEGFVGPAQATDVELGLAPADADRLLRSLRILIDAGARGVGEASLGVANTLYLTLKLLGLQQLVTDGVRDHTFLAIEEPEAHLHPQLQRNVFRSLLRGRAHLPEEQGGTTPSSTTVLLTTHSPHIASVAPLRSLVLLRSSDAGSTAVSTAGMKLNAADEEDLERYLDVTRAEMLFARGVLLVEGDAEVFVIPRLASFLGLHLDALGISVCSVGGVNFKPYVKLLRQLAIPFAVTTDYDQVEGGSSLGRKRVVSLMKLLMPTQDYDATDEEGIIALAPDYGIFLGTSTFELDLLRSERGAPMCKALIDAALSNVAKKRAEKWLADKRVSPGDEPQFLSDIESIGKGRFAQRLASTLQAKAKGQEGPPYIVDALHYLAKRCPTR